MARALHGRNLRPIALVPSRIVDNLSRSGRTSDILFPRKRRRPRGPLLMERSRRFSPAPRAGPAGEFILSVRGL